MAAHRQPAYAGRPSGDLHTTEVLTETSLILPLYHGMTTSDIERVISAVKNVTAKAVL